MENRRKYRKTIVYFQSKYQPEQIWEFLTHPKYIVDFTKEPCFHNEIDDNFKLEKNNSWKEIHTGKDCNGDKVECKIIGINKYNNFSTVRHQAGIKNTTIFKLKKNKEGTLISEEQLFFFSLISFGGLGIISWIILITGALAKFSFKPDEDLFWFEKMEKTIANNQLGDSTINL
ncbi:hypothetical protein [Aquimarina macrocephali]|uniref:hypothetical protein n=1 Tax=Aquimarina macrocephali TaxID=666563 RepID=UPI0004641F87|nr:hypothetical protein [Aquimarina macrocephali]